MITFNRVPDIVVGLYMDGVPAGAVPIMAWQYNDEVIVEIANIPEEDAFLHDCDIEGCSTFNHVVRFRIKDKYKESENENEMEEKIYHVISSRIPERLANTMRVVAQELVELFEEKLNSLVSEDEIGCECDCCRGDHARIAMRVIEEYLKCVGGLNLVEVNHFKDWLSQQESEG